MRNAVITRVHVIARTIAVQFIIVLVGYLQSVLNSEVFERWMLAVLTFYLRILTGYAGGKRFSSV